MHNRFINNKFDKMGAVELTMMGASYRSFQNWNIERVERYSGEIYVFTCHCAHFYRRWGGGGGMDKYPWDLEKAVRALCQNIFYPQLLLTMSYSVVKYSEWRGTTVYVRIIIILFTSTDYWTIKWKEKVIFNNWWKG